MPPLLQADHLFRHSPIGIAAIRFDGIVRDANDAYCALYGAPADGVLDHPFTDVLPIALREQAMEEHLRVIQNGGEQECECEILRPDNSVLHVQIKSTRVLCAEGHHWRIAYVTDITARRKMERDLEISHAFSQSILDGLRAHICVLDEQGKILTVNQAWRDYANANQGRREDTEEGTNYLDVCKRAAQTAETISKNNEAHHAASFHDLLHELINNQRQYGEFEYPCHSPEERRWFLARAARMRDANPPRIVVAHDEVTEIKLAQERLETTLHFTRDLINAMQDGFLVLDEHKCIIDANPAFCGMTGYTREELLGNCAPFAFWPPDEVAQIQSEMTEPSCGDIKNLEHNFMHKSGRRFPAIVTASVIRDSCGKPISYITTVKDIDERKRVEERVHQMAFYDSLTNLPNRRLLTDRLNQTLLASKQSGKYGALLMLDLDNFKPLNDEHGHHVGDLLLVEVGLRLQECVRDLDTVARLGGDEFVIIIRELFTDFADSFQQAEVIAEKIRASIAEPYRLVLTSTRGNSIIEHECTTSIGVTFFVNGVGNQFDILRHADHAMYRAKQDGRNLVRIYEIDD